MSELSKRVWQHKYRYALHGKILDSTIEASWQRVAGAIAMAESVKSRQAWEKTFFKSLEDFRFLPGGRILAGAGTESEVTLFNCFVMGIAKDSLQAVFDALAEAELTLQYGGGVGYDFSILRPKGDETHHGGLPARGPVALMRLWDTMSASLQARGARRGAMMSVLRCDHPDIEAFIEVKANSAELRHFNLSVMVTDAFMQAVRQDESWALVFPQKGQIYRQVKARELWQKIIRAAYDYAEPGVLFADTINRFNNLAYCETIKATNPCGEIPLQEYGACNLGSINLTQFVVAPFTPKATINWQALEETAGIATRFLDNVIDVSHYPLARQREQALGTRRIGLGIAGLADMLVMLGLRYNGIEATTLAAEIMRRIADVTWQVSIELAREKGGFPFYQPAYLQGEYVKQLSPDMQALIKKQGIRNSHHNAIAPTGSISLLANNISNGIEPIFRASYERNVRMHSEEFVTYEIHDYAYQLWRQTTKEDAMPPAWQDVAGLLPEDHLNIQAAMQRYVDNAISKTINLPEDFPFEKLADVYTSAYERGLKGCTVFRSNPVTGSILQEGKRQPCCSTKV